jgi:hypothetical protein
MRFPVLPLLRQPQRTAGGIVRVGLGGAFGLTAVTGMATYANATLDAKVPQV